MSSSRTRRRGNRTGSRGGPSGGPGGRWARPKRSLPRDSRRLSSRKEIQTGRLPPTEEPRLAERVTVPQGSRGSRARVSLAGAPPSSPNPSRFQTTDHDPPGLGDHERGPCDAHLPWLSREPRGFDFKELQLQLGLPPPAAATVAASAPKKLGLESPEMPTMGSSLWGRS